MLYVHTCHLYSPVWTLHAHTCNHAGTGGNEMTLVSSCATHMYESDSANSTEIKLMLSRAHSQPAVGQTVTVASWRYNLLDCLCSLCCLKQEHQERKLTRQLFNTKRQCLAQQPHMLKCNINTHTLTFMLIEHTVIWKIFSVELLSFCAIIDEIKSHEFFSTMDN